MSELQAGLQLALYRALTDLRHLQRTEGDAASLREAEKDLKSAIENLSAFLEAICGAGDETCAGPESSTPQPRGPAVRRFVPYSETTHI